MTLLITIYELIHLFLHLYLLVPDPLAVLLLQVLKFFFCFTWETNNEITRQSNIWACRAQPINRLKVLFAVMLAVHCLENIVRARLNGQMQINIKTCLLYCDNVEHQ